MRKLVCAACLLSLSASAQTMYRWKDKNGQIVYSDDPTKAPKGAKVETTDGVAITVGDVPDKVKEKKHGKKDKDDLPPEAYDEIAWRGRFTSAQKRVDDLEAKIKVDEEALNGSEVSVAGIKEMIEVDPQIGKVAERLRNNRDELVRAKRYLEDLTKLADQMNVPQGWRK